MSTDFLPRDIFINTTPPLTACFKKSEAECAAALLLWGMQCTNSWEGLLPQELGKLMTDEVMREEPLASWGRNPFFRPDFQQLVTDGFVLETEKRLTFSDKGLTALRTSHWYRGPK